MPASPPPDPGGGLLILDPLLISFIWLGFRVLLNKGETIPKIYEVGHASLGFDS